MSMEVPPAWELTVVTAVCGGLRRVWGPVEGSHAAHVHPVPHHSSRHLHGDPVKVHAINIHCLKPTKLRHRKNIYPQFPQVGSWLISYKLVRDTWCRSTFCSLKPFTMENVTQIQKYTEEYNKPTYPSISCKNVIWLMTLHPYNHQ